MLPASGVPFKMRRLMHRGYRPFSGPSTAKGAPDTVTQMPLKSVLIYIGTLYLEKLRVLTRAKV